MPYVHYTANGSIRGVYDQKDEAPLPNLLITPEQRKRLLLRPERFRIESGQLKETEIGNVAQEVRSGSDLAKKKATASVEITKPLTVDGITYTVDVESQTNLLLGLSITSADQTKVIRLWCKTGEGWEFREHSRDELLAIAEAFNERREKTSAALYE